MAETKEGVELALVKLYLRKIQLHGEDLLKRLSNGNIPKDLEPNLRHISEKFEELLKK